MTSNSQFGNIPEELRRLSQWVNWRIVQREGKQTKVPMQPRRVPASSTDPETWNTFERVARMNGQFNEIGFVFTTEAGYVGINSTMPQPEHRSDGRVGAGHYRGTG